MFVYVVREFYYEYDSNWEDIVGIYATPELAHMIRNACDMNFEINEKIAEAKAEAMNSYHYSEYDKMEWTVDCWEVVT